MKKRREGKEYQKQHPMLTLYVVEETFRSFNWTRWGRNWRQQQM